MKEGEQRQADFINCIAWRQTGESIAKFVKKGVRIALEGTLQTRSWTDSDGKTHYVMEVVVEQWEFAQSKNEGGAAAAPAAQKTYRAPVEASIDDFIPIDDEGLPF